MATLDQYLRFAVKSAASDLHLSLGREPTLRLNGTLREIRGHITCFAASVREIRGHITCFAASVAGRFSEA
jgi:Tfp pilus assembly pilus retraction ATPase PilT